MDKFRIRYQCNKIPDSLLGLDGYELTKNYVGRSFNGFFELSSKWGSGSQTKMIDKAIFQEYFEITPEVDK